MTSLARTDTEEPRRTLRVAPPVLDVDLDAAEQAAAALLHALGIATDSESLRGTPGRMVRAYAELFTSPEFDLTTFPNDEGYDELVLARSIPMRSVCEHHLLPFTGVAHVGYLPRERIIGLSKLARVVGHFAARPQVQERLTKQVSEAIQEAINPQGVAVILEAQHLCMMMRGVEKQHSSTVTSAMLGVFKTQLQTRNEFLSLVRQGSTL